MDEYLLFNMTTINQYVTQEEENFIKNIYDRVVQDKINRGDVGDIVICVPRKSSAFQDVLDICLKKKEPNE